MTGAVWIVTHIVSNGIPGEDNKPKMRDFHLGPNGMQALK